MQSAALLWHVSLLVPAEKRALALGLMGLVRVGPVVVFSLISGVAADTYDRRRLMLVTQSIMAVLAGVLAVLTLRGLSVAWPVYALSACSSVAGAFDLPARQALVPTLVPRQHLSNAISLNTIMVQIASVVGPALGGLVIALSGVGWVYILNAISYTAVVSALLMMNPDRARRPGAELDDDGTRSDLTLRSALEGLRFVFRAPLIRSTMLVDFFATFFSSATALLPIFAQDVLHVGARGYGWLFAAPATGAVITSAIMIAAVDRIEYRGRMLIGAVLVYGLATVGFGISSVFAISFLCLALTGAADTVSMVFRNLIRQLETPDRLRGRMVGVNMVFFMGGPQLGELEAGLVAAWRGPVFSVVSGGIGCVIVTLWIAAMTPMLRAYRRTALPLIVDRAGEGRPSE
jgi:MFS family permease